jgi:glutamyl-tRNA reductase
MILGESQILGQVMQAYQVAAAHGTAGPILSGLFRSAIRAGKRARTDTAISRNPATLSSVAVKLATQAAGDLAAQRVLVVGAGEMAELAVEALRARGVTDLTVINRTRTRAAQMAQRWGAQVLPFEQLAGALAQADLILTSTDAPNAVISADLMRTALERRRERPVVIIDIAVPRDVDPEVRRLPSVHYYDIDDLSASLNGALAERQQEVPRVEAIVAEETRAYLEWLNGLAVAPVIASLRAKAEALRRYEVEKTLRRLPQLDAAERRQIEALTEALMNKLLHAPIQRLKAESQHGSPDAYTATVRELFALND